MKIGMISIRCEKCNHIMVLMKSSDSDFIKYSSRYHYKCTKPYCSNYCVKIFSSDITENHELNKQIISIRPHKLQSPEIIFDKIIPHYEGYDNGVIIEQTNPIKYGLTNKEQIIMENNEQSPNKVLMRGGQIPGTEFPSVIERVRIIIEYDINSIVRITPEDIGLAIREMYEQIDLVEDNLPDSFKTQISNFNCCEIWHR